MSRDSAKTKNVRVNVAAASAADVRVTPWLPRTGAPPPYGVLQSWFRMYLDAQGELLAEPSGVRAFGQFLAEVVQEGTSGDDEAMSAVACRDLSGRCDGSIETQLDAAGRRIAWWCPTCGASGSVAGWEGTAWDRRSVVAPVRKRPAVGA